MRIEFRKVGQRVSLDAMVNLRSFLEVRAAHASAKGTVLVDFQIGRLPYAGILGDGVAVISDDLEGVGVLSDEPVTARALENGENVSRFDGEPLTADLSRPEALVQVLLELERIDVSIHPSRRSSRGLPVWRLRLGASMFFATPILIGEHPVSSSPMK